MEGFSNTSTKYPTSSSLFVTLRFHTQIVFAVMFGCLSITATALNLTVLFLFIRYRRLRNISNRFLVSLAFGDLILGIAFGPITVAQLIIEPENQSCFFNAISKFLTSLMAISGVTLGCIAYDRYMKLQSADLYNQRMSKTKANIMIILPWMAPLPIFASKLFNNLCNIIVVLTVIMLSHTVLVCSYIALIKKIRQNISESTLTGEHQSLYIKLRQKNAVHFMGWIAFVALACTCPVYIRRIFSLIHMKCQWRFFSENEPMILIIVHTFFLLNSSLNPLMYFYRHPGFKSTLKKALRRKRKIKVYPAEDSK